MQLREVVVEKTDLLEVEGENIQITNSDKREEEQGTDQVEGVERRMMCDRRSKRDNSQGCSETCYDVWLGDSGRHCLKKGRLSWR